jgi:hypothetical protein
MHLVKGMHDVIACPTEIWCGAEWSNYNLNWTESIDKSDCEACLRAAKKYGHAAEQRLIRLIGGQHGA